MAEKANHEERLQRILEREKRYDAQAYRFIALALEQAVRRRKRRGHITGQELAWAVRDQAWKDFGLLARTVLNHWGLFTTRDIGEVVYRLIEEEILSRQESDSVSDFNEVYVFEKDLEEAFKFDS